MINIELLEWNTIKKMNYYELCVTKNKDYELKNCAYFMKHKVCAMCASMCTINALKSCTEISPQNSKVNPNPTKKISFTQNRTLDRKKIVEQNPKEMNEN